MFRIFQFAWFETSGSLIVIEGKKSSQFIHLSYDFALGGKRFKAVKAV